MIFCDAGCSGVFVPRDGRVFSSLLRLTEQLESEGMIMGRRALGLGTGAGRLAMTGGDLLRIRRVILSMVTAVMWLADGYWRQRCVRHVPDSVRAFLTAVELPGFVEVRVVDERRFVCPGCWAERMTGR